MLNVYASRIHSVTTLLKRGFSQCKDLLLPKLQAGVSTGVLGKYRMYIISGLDYTTNAMSELEITVGHRSISVHIIRMTDHKCTWSVILS